MQTTKLCPGLVTLFFASILALLCMGFVLQDAKHFVYKNPKKEILLKKNARKDGYTITHSGNQYFLKATKVTDPGTQKLLEGIRKLSYRCSNNGPKIETPIAFSAGNSEKIRLSCALIIEPKIILEEE